MPDRDDLDLGTLEDFAVAVVPLAEAESCMALSPEQDDG